MTDVKAVNTQANKIKHLEMIEAIVERMAKNCFQLKGWAMTLVAAVAALSSQSADKRFIVLAFIPIVGFWILDAFYLQTERRYNLLYKNVAAKMEEDIDFNLDARMATGTSADMERLCFFKCFFSVTETCFYGVVAVALIVLAIVLKIF